MKHLTISDKILGVIVGATILLAILKLTSVLNCSWLFVFSPLIVSVLFALITVLFLTFIIKLDMLMDKENEKL